MLYHIVQTDNFGWDYHDEKFLCTVNSEGKTIPLSYANKARAAEIAEILNGPYAEHNSRWWKVVEKGYVLSPGFEP